MDDETTVSPLDRFRHIYVPGQTQFGKSTLLANQVIDDITPEVYDAASDRMISRGVCVMDAKGDLINQILDAIPPHRERDIIFFDSQHPVPIDIFTYQDTFERDALISEITQVLLRTVNIDNAPEMGGNIKNILRTICNYNDNQKDPKQRATLLDIHYFLVDKERQKKILRGLNNSDLIHHWSNPKSFPDGQPLHRIRNRMDDYIHSPFLRALFDVPDPQLNMEWIINNRKILLLNFWPMSDQMLAYATIILSLIRQAIDRRGDIPKEKQIPFFLYCDEFHRYQTSDFPELLSRAGGLGLALTLANQWIDQLSAEVRRAVLGSASTYFLFHMNKDNASYFRGMFPEPKEKPDRSRELQRLQDRFDQTTQQLLALKQEAEAPWVDKLEPEQLGRYKQIRDRQLDSYQKRFEKIDGERQQTIRQIQRIREEVANAPSIPDYLAMLPDMPVGECLYKPAQGQGFRIRTPKPLGKRTNCAESIRKHTVEKPTCERPEKPHDVSSTLHDDDIPQAVEARIIPPHKGEA